MIDQHLKIRMFIVGMVLAASLGGSQARAQDLLDRETQTFFINADGGFTTYKSLLLESNDTATTVGYGLGVYAGSQRTLGIVIQQETSTVAFELNSSALLSQQQDVIIRYRWGPIYFGPVLGSAYMKANKAGEDLFEMRGSGYGGNLGLQMPITKVGYMYLDALSVTNGTVMEQDRKTAAFGARTDMDLGASIDLTKNLFDFVFGYKYRTLAISYDGASYAELITTTHLGFRMGWQF